jgi:Raf kinase inhibitor-like YbhB/YbcL family protein
MVGMGGSVMGVGHGIATIAGKLLTPLRGRDGKLATAREHGSAELRVATSSFQNGGKIPPRFAGDRGIAPALVWSGVPEQARELVLICEDPDAPTARPAVHWLLYRIPPRIHSLPEGIRPESATEGVLQGRNSLGRIGYVGPRPPRGLGAHRYHFQLFAVNTPLELGPGVDRDTLLRAMHHHVLACGEVVGSYENK